MACKYLGETIDIHAGGQDLMFPHHENEIAQSETRNGKKFANYWMHNGYITIDDEKMSKSKGNFFTVRDILKEYEGEVVRFFLLSGHYRNPVNFSREMMEQAKNGLTRIKNAEATLKHLINSGSLKVLEQKDAEPEVADGRVTLIGGSLKASGQKDAEPEVADGRVTPTGDGREDLICTDGGESTDGVRAAGEDDENKVLYELKQLRLSFNSAMDDDLNTADAISFIFEMVSTINAAITEGLSVSFAQRCLKMLRELADILGILPEEEQDAIDSDIMALVNEREEARKSKNFARADEIRDIFKGKGIILKDTPQGIQIVTFH
jgi:cysteinyl-tRNA synthetase